MAKYLQWITPPIKEKQPHRFHKQGISFTAGRSLKPYKKAAHGRARARTKNALKKEKDVPLESKNSVRYDYW